MVAGGGDVDPDESRPNTMERDQRPSAVSKGPATDGVEPTQRGTTGKSESHVGHALIGSASATRRTDIVDVIDVDGHATRETSDRLDD
ncbi:MAG: hypothetical protein AB7L84_09185 [Acidimicrobiia bacterium]